MKKILALILVIMTVATFLISCKDSNKHSCEYEDGICECGDINITKDNLKGKTYVYSHYKVSWSDSATEEEKEKIRKQYNEPNDTKLFEKIEDELDRYYAAYIDYYKFVFWSDEVKCYEPKDHEGEAADYIVEADGEIRIGDMTFIYGKNNISLVLGEDVLIGEIIFEEE